MDGENHTLFDGLPGFEMSREELKRLRTREYFREYNRKRLADPAYRERERERQRERQRKRRADPAYRERKRNLVRKCLYDLTPSQHQDYLLKQKGVCAICERPEKIKRKGVTMSLSVDHCHQTEEAHGMKFAVRGLLCKSCNTVLARATAHRSWFKKAKMYIEEFERGLKLKLMAAGIKHD